MLIIPHFYYILFIIVYLFVTISLSVIDYLLIIHRLRNIMRQSVMTQYNEIDPLPLYEKINIGPRGTYATFDMFYSYIAKLQLGYTMYDLEDVLKRIDKNNDEHISYFEFHYFLSDENEIYRIWEENVRVELLTDSEKRYI